jgi:pyranose oxidase
VRFDLEQTDVLIIGAGPVGSTFARVIIDGLPNATVLMVDAGPKLTRRAGMHVRNIGDRHERLRAQIASQGPMDSRSKSTRSPRPHPGTFLLDPDNYRFANSAMPAAAMSSNVGGMAAHWTCACPRLGNGEKITFIDDNEWRLLYEAAEAFLNVTYNAFPTTVSARVILGALRQVFDSKLPPEQRVGNMPLACTMNETGQRYWSGTDTILGPLALTETTPSNFHIRSETLCTRLAADDNGVAYAVLQHIPSRAMTTIRARIYIVACDAFRTPQLLWTSGITSKALGHYLNDQPVSVCTIQIDRPIVTDRNVREPDSVTKSAADVASDPIRGFFWVPFHAPNHPYHGQVIYLAESPIKTDKEWPHEGTFLSLGWFCRKDIRYDDYLEFVREDQDLYGLPKICVRYSLTENDKQEVVACKGQLCAAAAELGPFIDGGEPCTLPAGSSLHYQGTTRMGLTSCDESVCDPYCQVWGTTNLFLGGNCVIPTSIAANPTLTSVALAIRSARTICSILGG